MSYKGIRAFRPVVLGVVAACRWRYVGSLLISIVIAIAIFNVNVAPAWAQKLPDGFDDLIDKTKTGKKQEKTPQGEPKMGLKDPVCQSDECLKLWAQLRDALQSWYVLQLNPGNSTQESSDIAEALGAANSKELGVIRDNHAKRKKSDPANFGDKDKLAKYIKGLLEKYGPCLKPCDEKTKKKTTGGGDDDNQPPIEATGRAIPDPSKITLPTIPAGACWTQAQKDQYDKDASAASVSITNSLSEIKKSLSQLTDSLHPNRRLTAAAQTEKDALQAARTKLEAMSTQLDELNADADKKPICDDKKKSKTGSGSGSYYVPRRTPGTAYVTQNGTAVCTYDSGTPVEIAYTPISSGGQMIATTTPGTPSDVVTPPPTPKTPGATDTPLPVTTTPAPTPTETTPGNPPPVASTPATPPPTIPTTDATPTTPPPTTPTTDATLKTPPPTTPTIDTTPTTPPPTTTADTTPPTPDTPQDQDEVETYDKETVEQNGHTETGGALQGQVVMLTTPKPDLTRASDDAGSGSDPAKCTTGANGRCIVHIRRSDRAAYGLPDSSTPVHYELQLSAMKHSSGIADVTGKTVPSNLTSTLPAGDQVTSRIVKVGSRTFMAFDFAVPYNHAEDVKASVSHLLGVPVETAKFLGVTTFFYKPAAELEFAGARLFAPSTKVLPVSHDQIW